MSVFRGPIWVMCRSLRYRFPSFLLFPLLVLLSREFYVQVLHKLRGAHPSWLGSLVRGNLSSRPDRRLCDKISPHGGDSASHTPSLSSMRPQRASHLPSPQTEIS